MKNTGLKSIAHSSLALASLVSLQFSFAAAVAQSPLPARSAPLAASASTPDPGLVPYVGAALQADGKPLGAGEASVTFLLFAAQSGGEPLWTETQTVPVDATGHYEAYLGATHPSGLSANLFGTGEARWLEVQIAGEQPQPRVLLTSVPYAMKAADAATLGGLPASAFVLASSQLSSTASAITAAASAHRMPVPPQ